MHAGALRLPLALPATPQSSPLHRLTVGDAGCAVAAGIVAGWVPWEDAPMGGRGGVGGVGAAWHGAGGCCLASTLLLILQEGDLWTVESSRLGEGEGKGRVQARIWLSSLPRLG